MQRLFLVYDDTLWGRYEVEINFELETLDTYLYEVHRCSVLRDLPWIYAVSGGRSGEQASLALLRAMWRDPAWASDAWFMEQLHNDLIPGSWVPGRDLIGAAAPSGTSGSPHVHVMRGQSLTLVARLIAACPTSFTWIADRAQGGDEEAVDEWGCER